MEVVVEHLARLAVRPERRDRMLVGVEHALERLAEPLERKPEHGRVSMRILGVKTSSKPLKPQ